MSVGMPAELYLQQFGSLLADVFGLGSVYHVGSSVENKTWRDVDVRVILWEADWKAWGFIEDYGVAQVQDAKLIALTMAFSELGHKMTGLPIDFQIQPAKWANEKYPTKDKEGNRHPRSALAMVPWRFAGFKPIEAGGPSEKELEPVSPPPPVP